ncbi:MAG: hypothetical protein PHV34_10965 [Verrucomicrobiae bacterium]|nr:hypothetical protein [Verrucomicrobiae bacterium]
MNLDIRLPMGLMLAIMGAILTMYGLFTRSDPMYARSQDININLVWGAFMFIIGVIMVVMARRAMRASGDK